jgi:hypothetical protein
MKKLIFTGLLLSLLGVVYAQDFVDNALLFSRIQPGGSARIQALGGAQVSLGGDYSSALSNPAGLGMFNRSEITFSLGLNDNSTSSTYFGNTSDDGRTVFIIPGFSYVQKHEETKGKYLGGAFGFSYSRTNNFNAQYSYKGNNNESSILDSFINYANSEGLSAEDLDGDYYYTLTGLAFNGYRLIDLYEDADQNIYWDTELYPVDANGVYNYPTIRQSQQVTRKGSQSQLSFSYGGNYDDTFFFGASLGIASIRFRQEQLYEESDFRYSQYPNFNPVDRYTVDENFDIQGSGVNLTLGGIYRPIDFLQVGIAYVTPTFYNLTDSYVARIDSDWNNYDYRGLTLGNEFAEFDTPVISEYDLKTPGKFTAGATFISKYGFISGDFEFVHYNNAKYNSNIQGISFSEENGVIKSAHKNAMNYRLGAEFRYDLFRFRGGYNYQTDPYQIDNNMDRSIQTISGGAGIRTTDFYIDFTLLQAKGDSQRIPYFADELPTPITKQKNTTTNFLVTVGFPF